MDTAILTAALSVLSEFGYGGLTFEAVAQRAGLYRPALYRRFGSKRELVVALVRSMIHQIDPDPTSDGDPRTDLLHHVTNAILYLRGRGGAAVFSLAHARREDAELAQAMEELYDGERVFYVQALNRAAGRELPPDFCHLVIDALLGAVMFRVAFRNAELHPYEVEILVDQALQAVTSGTAPSLGRQDRRAV